MKARRALMAFRFPFPQTATKLFALSAAVLCLSPCPTPAEAYPRPIVGPVDAPPDPRPAPPHPMRQRSECVVSAVLEHSDFTSVPAGEAFDVRRLHEFADGSGVLVAVVDSGVAPNARLPLLRGGGDYVMGDKGGDGLEDCDHHGTLVAGVIAAQPSGDDGFTGVAPGAEVLSIRQHAQAYQFENPPREFDQSARAQASLDSLADAITHAANLGARVINVSVTACAPADAPPSTERLAAALSWAVLEKDALVVAAAGNAGSGRCKQNPHPPVSAMDEDGWDSVETISLPGVFDSLVLSVGGETLDGDPYANTMAGPWMQVAAPAMNIVSLDPSRSDGALVDAELVRGKITQLNGTSFAAAFVSGLAALIRQKYPELTAPQVSRRITATAHQVGDSTRPMMGYGQVDPVAALTAYVDVGAKVNPRVPSVRAPKAVAPAPVDEVPMRAGQLAIIACLFLLVVAGMVTYTKNGGKS